MKRLLIASSLSVVLVAAAACGGGGGSKRTPAAGTPGAIATAAGPPVDLRGLQTPTSGEATVIATPYELVNYHHDAIPRRQGTDVIDFPYDVLVPKGWVVESTGIAVTASLPRPDKFPYLTVTIDCRPFSATLQDKAQMIAEDSASATKLGLGNLGTQTRATTTIGGRDATRVDWTGSGTFKADHISVYVNGEECAWRLQLNVFGGIHPTQVSALFERILEKFNPAQGLPK